MQKKDEKKGCTCNGLCDMPVDGEARKALCLLLECQRRAMLSEVAAIERALQALGPDGPTADRRGKISAL
jgi:hypothetical protein